MSTDPKKKAGDLKDPLHLLPTEPLRQTARVLKLGAVKYGVYNWRDSDGVNASTYSASMLRHMFQFMDGEDTDLESGESHLAHIMATCCILIDADSVGKLLDDRHKDSRTQTQDEIRDEIHRKMCTKEPVKQWKPPCDVFESCLNAIYPTLCMSCVERPEGRTNHKINLEVDV